MDRRREGLQLTTDGHNNLKPITLSAVLIVKPYAEYLKDKFHPNIAKTT
jgi:hypothetical protein